MISKLKSFLRLSSDGDTDNSEDEGKEFRVPGDKECKTVHSIDEIDGKGFYYLCGKDTVYKATRDGIVELQITNSPVVKGSENGYKLRTDEAKVVDIKSFSMPCTRARSIHEKNFYYVLGETVEPRYPFDPAIRECASGIHFFKTKRQAKRYAVRQGLLP